MLTTKGDSGSMKVKIIVFSDYICPFCFIGKHRIERLKTEFNIDVQWESFELYPEDSSLPDPSYLERVWVKVKQLAEDAGINIRRPSTLPRSRLALEGAEYAKEEGKFQQYHDGVFEAYFQLDKDIGSIKVLLWVAKKISLDLKDFEYCLVNRTMKNKIEEQRREAVELGINAIPTFIIGDERIVGAQPYERLRSAVEEVVNSR